MQYTRFSLRLSIVTFRQNWCFLECQRKSEAAEKNKKRVEGGRYEDDGGELGEREEKGDKEKAHEKCEEIQVNMQVGIKKTQKMSGKEGKENKFRERKGRE